MMAFTHPVLRRTGSPNTTIFEHLYAGGAYQWHLQSQGGAHAEYNLPRSWPADVLECWYL